MTELHYLLSKMQFLSSIELYNYLPIPFLPPDNESLSMNLRCNREFYQEVVISHESPETCLEMNYTRINNFEDHFHLVNY